MENKKYGKALILAGGRGRRMGGRDKSSLTYRRDTFLERIVSALSDYEDISVSVNRGQSIEIEGLSTVVDTHEDIGPLSGIYEGLRLAQAEGYEEVFLLPCDCPNICRGLVEYISEYNAGECDALVIEEMSGEVHPLLGIYRTSVLPVVEEAISRREYRVRGIFDRIDVGYIPLKDAPFDEARVLRNINTEEEYRKLLNEDIAGVSDNIHDKK